MTRALVRSAPRRADASYYAGLALERLAYGLLAGTDDHREATAAFGEKREPRFRGR
jgi:hypothetical protein